MLFLRCEEAVSSAREEGTTTAAATIAKLSMSELNTSPLPVPSSTGLLGKNFEVVIEAVIDDDGIALVAILCAWLTHQRIAMSLLRSTR